MKAILPLILIFACFAGLSQSGKVMESQVFQSKIVNYPVEYSVYLPPDYDLSQRKYPILYLLHGFSDDETGWIQYGEVNLIADKGIANGDFPPCIIVMPDAKVGWYCNSSDGKDLWEDMFVKEFIPYIETNYRARDRKEFRAIAGLSMGGYGALHISMHHPELFASCVALSAAVFTDEEIISLAGYDNYFRNIFGNNLVGVSRVNDHWKANSPLHLAEIVPAELLKTVRFYIDCGDDDFLYKGNSTLHIKMRDRMIPHEFRARDGSHEWEYWRTGIFDGLVFISKTFHR